MNFGLKEICKNFKQEGIRLLQCHLFLFSEAGEAVEAGEADGARRYPGADEDSFEEMFRMIGENIRNIWRKNQDTDQE